MCVGKEDTSQQTAGIKLARRVRKARKDKDSDNKKNGAWDNCIAVGHYARNCTKKKEWTILAMKEKPFQFAGATVLPVKTVSKIAVATIIGYLDCWDRQEVIIKCKHQNMVRRAELLQGRRRPRGTIVECILEGRRQSNVVVENAHHHLPDNTDESVNVKPLLASWLARYCVWKLARLAIGDDGLAT